MTIANKKPPPKMSLMATVFLFVFFVKES